MVGRLFSFLAAMFGKRNQPKGFTGCTKCWTSYDRDTMTGTTCEIYFVDGRVVRID